MQVDIKLYKKEGTYTDKEGKEKPFVNLFINVNGKNIPVEVKYFPNPKLENRDPGYQSRVFLLSSLAEPLPVIEASGKDE